VSILCALLSPGSFLILVLSPLSRDYTYRPTDIMHVTSKVLAGLLISSSHAAAAAPGCAGGIYALIATRLSSFQPAQLYCISKYPVAPATTTKTAPPVTSTVTATAQTTTTAPGAKVTLVLLRE
jgi:hypothetical protein